MLQHGHASQLPQWLSSVQHTNMYASVRMHIFINDQQSSAPWGTHHGAGATRHDILNRAHDHIILIWARLCCALASRRFALGLRHVCWHVGLVLLLWLLAWCKHAYSSPPACVTCVCRKPDCVSVVVCCVHVRWMLEGHRRGVLRRIFQGLVTLYTCTSLFIR
jgi:hypothetical protein